MLLLVKENSATEPKYKIGRMPIGPNAVPVVVNSALSFEASLWRPTTDVLTLDEDVGYKIAWPMDKVILDMDPIFCEDVSMVKFSNLIIVLQQMCYL